MDASSYLRKQGWRGEGHSLDHSDRGIKKPLLVSKKVDVLGVGLNKYAAVSDQWWLRAFDQGLKSLGTGEESVLASVQKHGVNRGGLYGRFVKGERIAGSIGQSLQGSEESGSTGASTPVEVASEAPGTMAVDVPPEDKLETVVAHHGNQEHHDAMMYLLQNPNDAPVGMKKMLDRKRKRAERPVEKRARRKTERHEKAKHQREEFRREAIEERTWDANEEEGRRKMKEISRKANDLVPQAQKRGIIPLGPHEIRKGIMPTGANAEAVTDQRPTDALQQIIHQANLNTEVKVKGSGKTSLKAETYRREKMKRELKRAAKAYLMGENPPDEQTSEERKAKKAEKKLKTAKKTAETAETAKRDAERMARREEKAAYKRERRAKKKMEKAEIDRILAEREAVEKAGKTVDEHYAERVGREAAGVSGDDPATNGHAMSNGFDGGADEIKFGMNSKGGRKKIAGVGAVDRYPIKAEKKARRLKAAAIREGVSEEEIKARIKAEQDRLADEERVKVDRYRALKHGVSLEGYKSAIANGEVLPVEVERKKIAPEKLAEYQKRAAEKGVSLEQYIRKREEKNAAKQTEKLGNPFQKDMRAAAA